MKLPLKISSASLSDAQRGGEFHVLRDSDGSWVGDIRSEHSADLLAAANHGTADALAKRVADYFKEWAPRMRTSDAQYGSDGDWQWLAEHLVYIATSSAEPQMSVEMLARKTAAIHALAAPYQDRVDLFMLKCFGLKIATDSAERNHRFIEESLELAQANGCSAEDAHMLVDYVFGRPSGEPRQEVGGVMVTLAALCNAAEIDLTQAAEAELERVNGKIEVIREKQKAKPKGSPLPQHVVFFLCRAAGEGSHNFKVCADDSAVHKFYAEMFGEEGIDDFLESFRNPESWSNDLTTFHEDLYCATFDCWKVTADELRPSSAGAKGAQST